MTYTQRDDFGEDVLGESSFGVAELVIVRTATDDVSATFTDAAVRVNGRFFRTASDSAPAVDSITSSVAIHPRTTSDSAPITTDTAVRVALPYKRGPPSPDSAPATDAATRVGIRFGRAGPDVISGISDSAVVASIKYRYGRPVADITTAGWVASGRSHWFAGTPLTDADPASPSWANAVIVGGYPRVKSGSAYSTAYTEVTGGYSDFDFSTVWYQAHNGTRAVARWDYVNQYYVQWLPDGSMEFRRYFGSAAPQDVSLGTLVGNWPVTSTVTFRWRAIGSQHTFWVNGVQVLQVTEGTFLTGRFYGFQEPVADQANAFWDVDFIAARALSTSDPLWGALDEAPASDADSITQSAYNPSSLLTEVKLGPMTTPASAASVAIRYRIGKEGAGQGDLVVSLVQGTTVIATWTHTNIPQAYQTITQTLTGPQFAAISDWTDLRLRFTANAVSAVA